MKNCKNCTKEFTQTKDRSTFCSHYCQGLFNIKNIKRTGRKKTGENIECITCKSIFYAPKYRVKKGKAKYCSRSCLAKKHFAQFAHHRFKTTGNPPHKYKSITINGKQIRLHRYVMEQYLGRKLEPWEHVHHINGDSSDNRIKNLAVLSNSEHQKQEHKYRKSLISSSSLFSV